MNDITNPPVKQRIVDLKKALNFCSEEEIAQCLKDLYNSNGFHYGLAKVITECIKGCRNSKLDSEVIFHPALDLYAKSFELNTSGTNLRRFLRNICSQLSTFDPSSQFYSLLRKSIAEVFLPYMDHKTLLRFIKALSEVEKDD